jgi:CheY-like chemotaxis protein
VLLVRDGWPPDLLLSDLRLPSISGVELTRRIHTFAPDLPVVLTTCLEETYDICTSAPGYGAVACLRKPMNMAGLLWTIDRALTQRPALLRAS